MTARPFSAAPFSAFSAVTGPAPAAPAFGFFRPTYGSSA